VAGRTFRRTQDARPRGPGAVGWISSHGQRYAVVAETCKHLALYRHRWVPGSRFSSRMRDRGAALGRRLSAFDRSLDEKVFEIAMAVENGKSHNLPGSDAEHHPAGALDDLPILEETDVVELWKTCQSRHSAIVCSTQTGAAFTRRNDTCPLRA
jgi:hypothetical protein